MFGVAVQVAGAGFFRFDSEQDVSDSVAQRCESLNLQLLGVAWSCGKGGCFPVRWSPPQLWDWLWEPLTGGLRRDHRGTAVRRPEQLLFILPSGSFRDAQFRSGQRDSAQ
ncbi:MAG: hypothetical protein BJ554DRAFT_6839 [Olpidium bornovanus]|uniref:Uncharacterized protein n=1 Tax=Olpidium bornovanus TaxID=278681 RepID=A0A8H7ZWW1_9FUNG|nr:MAG: hypothetical protein BJ554DRAFT_6839 [Olpidium bornovanus]